MKRYGLFFAIVFILTLLLLVPLNKSTYFNWLHVLQSYSGIKAIFIFSTIYILCNLFFIPLGLPLNLLAGVLWGTFLGGLLINGLASLVAALSFLIARKFSLAWGAQKIFSSQAFIRLTSAIKRYDWQFITMMRINPIVPFCASNYAFGLIPRLSFKTYMIATILANLLPCYAFAAIGAVYKTFMIDNQNLQNIIFAISLALLLISIVFLIKIFCQQGESQDEQLQS